MNEMSSFLQLYLGLGYSTHQRIQHHDCTSDSAYQLPVQVILS